VGRSGRRLRGIASAEDLDSVSWIASGGARLALAAVVLVASWAATIGIAAGADGAAALFDPATVYVVHLTLPPSSIAELEAEPDEYVAGEFSIATTAGTPASEGTPSAPVPVEVRLKGSTSFETLDGKAAFKLKFPKASRPSAFGLKKMTLNNMVQDPSMVHETLSYETFRAAGVPAPRTGFAYVYVNDEDYGMHLNLETLDDQSLESIFGTEFDSDTQHLYEGENGADVVPGGAADFQVDEGDEASFADLEALIGAVNSTGSAPWSERVAPYADLQEMTRMWAVEKYVGHWDGYSGVKETANQPNNYYLYNTPQGLFQMLPWGTDETFQSNRHIAFDGRGSGSLFGLCLDDAACAATYWHSLDATVGVAQSLDLASRAAALDSMLAPWQELEQSNGRFSYTRAEAHAEAIEAADFADLRVGEAEAWLAAHQPPAEEPEGETPGEGGAGDGGSGGSGGSGASSGSGLSGSSGGSRSSGSRSAQSGSRSARSGPIAAGEPSPRPRLVHLHATEEGLRSRLRLWTDATVSQRATFATPRGRRTACLIRARSHEAGEVVLECHFRRAARRRLHHGPLRLLITTTVKSNVGTKTLRSGVTLPRP